FLSLTTPLPPISTLFPYTTLFRSVPTLDDQQIYVAVRSHLIPRRRAEQDDLVWLRDFDDATDDVVQYHLIDCLFFTHLLCLLRRSEEHTSELQSLAYLVCRLLLEK